MGRTLSRISWDCPASEKELITKIAERASKRYAQLKIRRDQVDIMMDITATHCNGTKLNLAKLLVFDDFNFMHDVVGIANHIDRRTGKLERTFLPRSAR